MARGDELREHFVWSGRGPIERYGPAPEEVSGAGEPAREMLWSSTAVSHGLVSPSSPKLQQRNIEVSLLVRAPAPAMAKALALGEAHAGRFLEAVARP